MEETYKYIGMAIFWLSVLFGFLFIIGFLAEKICNKLGEHFKTMWIILEFVYYKQEFIEWVKDKKRHPKTK